MNACMFIFFTKTAPHLRFVYLLNVLVDGCIRERTHACTYIYTHIYTCMVHNSVLK